MFGSLLAGSGLSDDRVEVGEGADALGGVGNAGADCRQQLGLRIEAVRQPAGNCLLSAQHVAGVDMPDAASETELGSDRDQIGRKIVRARSFFFSISVRRW